MRNLRNIVCAGLVLGAAFIATSSASATVVKPPSHREVVCHAIGNGGYVAIPPAKASAHDPKHDKDVVILTTYPSGVKWSSLKRQLDDKCGKTAPPPRECPDKPKPEPPPVVEPGTPEPSATAKFVCTSKGGRVILDLDNTGDWSAQFTINGDVVYLGPESSKRIILIPREDTDFRVTVKFGDLVLVDKTWKVDCVRLRVNKSVNRQIVKGKNRLQRWTLAVENNGPKAVRVRVADVLPKHVSLPRNSPLFKSGVLRKSFMLRAGQTWKVSYWTRADNVSARVCNVLRVKPVGILGAKTQQAKACSRFTVVGPDNPVVVAG